MRVVDSLLLVGIVALIVILGCFIKGEDDRLDFIKDRACKDAGYNGFFDPVRYGELCMIENGFIEVKFHCFNNECSFVEISHTTGKSPY